MAGERLAHAEEVATRPHRTRGLLGRIGHLGVETGEELAPKVLANRRDSFTDFGKSHGYGANLSSRSWGQLAHQFLVFTYPEYFQRFNDCIPEDPLDFVVRFQTVPIFKPDKTIYQHEDFVVDLEVESLKQYVSIIEERYARFGNPAYKMFGRGTGPKIVDFWHEYSQWALGVSAQENPTATEASLRAVD